MLQCTHVRAPTSTLLLRCTLLLTLPTSCATSEPVFAFHSLLQRDGQTMTCCGTLAECVGPLHAQQAHCSAWCTGKKPNSPCEQGFSVGGFCKGVSPQVVSNFLVLGLQGGVMMAADACSFVVTTVMASILGEPAISVFAQGARAGALGAEGLWGSEGEEVQGRGGEMRGELSG